MTDLLDPQTDARATYALDPARVRRLASVATATGENHDLTTPMTGAPLGIIALSTEADVDEVYATARAAQPAWAARPLRERTDIVLRYHDLVMAHRSELMDFIQLESGKARRHAFEEVGDVAIGARHYARNAARYLKPRSRLGGFPLISRPVESYLPKGVVGIVSPWN